MSILYAVLVLGALAVIFGLALAVAAKVFEVKEDPRLAVIQENLAGANCGGCGYPGCGGCAAAILAGKAPVNACPASSAENVARIAEALGIKAEVGEKKVARVLCNGGCAAKRRYDYVGLNDCIAASKVAAGPLECKYGCFGCGTCVEACHFGALRINANGVAEVDKEKCTNCGACRKACPRGLIGEVPYSKEVFVSCANRDKGPAAAKVCDNACIACGLCAKACPNGAITMENNLPVIDFEKCVDCGKCALACPKNVIFPIPTAEAKEAYKAEQKAAAAAKAAAAKAAAEAKAE